MPLRSAADNKRSLVWGNLSPIKEDGDWLAESKAPVLEPEGAKYSRLTQPLTCPTTTGAHDVVPFLTLVPVLIVISMSVAYLTADFQAVSNIFSDPDQFVKADPFPFWLTALIVVVFGPGMFSIDALIERILHCRKKVNFGVSS